MLTLKNIGSGPAIGVSWRFLDEDRPIFDDSSDFAVGHEKKVTGLFGASAMVELAAHGGLRIEYSNLAGKQYWTKIRIRIQGNTVQSVVTTGEILRLTPSETEIQQMQDDLSPE